MSTLLSTLLLAALPALAGPADRAYALSDAPAGQDATTAALKASKMGSKVPTKATRRVMPRTAAWTSVGRLEVLDEQVLSNARIALMTRRNHGNVRARAAWSVGELSRGRSKAEAEPVSQLLKDAMRDDIDAETAYHVVEAFGKSYTPHEHGFDENLDATKAMNTLAANQIEQMPAIYYVVLNRVLTFEVAIQLVRDEVAEARTQRDEQSLAEAYNAVLTAVRWMAARQDVLVTSYADDRQRIESAFDALLGALDVNDQRLTLMLVWSLGNISAEPVFAELVGGRVGQVAGVRDPMVRHLTAWSLYRLRTSLPAREAMRDTVLGREVDQKVFEMLARMRTDKDEMDVVQKMWSVEPRK